MRVGRTAIGCLVGVAALVGVMLLVRPLIFSVAPPRDDSRVVIGSASQFADGPERVVVALSRSYGLDSERPLGGGRVQLALIGSQGEAANVVALSAASSVADACPVEPMDGRLVDCAGRAWALDGAPLEAGRPPLERFATTIENGVVYADLTQPLAVPGE
jgi:hypothetical protein